MNIEELGEFKFIDHITRGRGCESLDSSTVVGIGDDAAVVELAKKQHIVLSVDTMYEGVHFNLAYTPLKHLGYKAVVVAASDICAMGGVATKLMISLGISSGFSVEMIDELYEGVNIALKEHGIELIGGDTSASYSGLVISLTAIGTVEANAAITRGGAKENEVICVSGDLGSSFLGEKLLEREKNVADDSKNSKNLFSNYKYLIERALKPSLRSDVIEALSKAELKPTAMIDISDGLASELLHICKKSEVGARIYIDRLPIVEKAFDAGDELGIDPIIAAMNGGEDYELLFTLPAEEHEKVEMISGISIIGYITNKDKGIKLLTAQGSEINITAQGHKEL